jgi:hypothetical protein
VRGGPNPAVDNRQWVSGKVTGQANRPPKKNDARLLTGRRRSADVVSGQKLEAEPISQPARYSYPPSLTDCMIACRPKRSQWYAVCICKCVAYLPTNGTPGSIRDKKRL